MIILWYVMDSLRSDFLSCYGYNKKTSPKIDSFAETSVRFTNAFSQATWTRPSGASMLSSMYPAVHGVNGMDDNVPRYVTLLPEYLKKIGFRTFALSTMGNISPFFGFNKGFDLFIELYKEPAVAKKRRMISSGNPQWKAHFQDDNELVPISTSEDINDYLFPLLNKYRDDDLFVFAWSLDTHGPYCHRDMKLARFYRHDDILLTDDIQKAKLPEEIDVLRGLYEDMIVYNDNHFGVLIEKLKELDIYDNAFIVLTGDHGEAFGEHETTSHGRIPYDEQIRVPLIMKFPHSEFLGEISDIVQHIDIMPCILDYLKVPMDKVPLQGKSMLPLLRNGVKINDYTVAELWPGRQYLSYISLRTNDYKYIAVRRPEIKLRQLAKDWRKLWPSPWFVYKPLYLFNLRKDSKETMNVINEEKKIVRDFGSRTAEIVAANKNLMRMLENAHSGDRRSKANGDKTTDAEVVKQLKALGYFD